MRTAIRVITCYAFVSVGAVIASGLILLAASVAFNHIVKG